MEVRTQKLQESGDPMQKAYWYYSILSVLYGWELANKQIELLAFTAVRGTITPLAAKEAFVKKYKSSDNSVENLKGQLTRRGLMIKDENGMYRVNPRIVTDFTLPFILQITMNGQDETASGDENSHKDFSAGEPSGQDSELPV